MAESPRDVQRIFHVNINCSDFARSLAFYRLIGFDVVLDFEDLPPPHRSFGALGLGPALGLPDDCDGRAALLALGGDPGAVRLDLIEWKAPLVPSQPRRNLAQPGIARLCLKVSDAYSVHARLVAAGHQPYSPPTLISLGGRLKVFCCEDPDGAVIEFMQFLGTEGP